MQKQALYIPRPGLSSARIMQGYVDALRFFGWNVIISDPKTKFNCRKLIENYDFSIIFTHSRYGIRQLPVDLINQKYIVVFVNVLPLSNPIDGPYETAHDDEVDIIKSINHVVPYTHIEPHLWSRHMQEWYDELLLSFIPLAGNMVKAIPDTYSVFADVAMVANFAHKLDRMEAIIRPLFQHLGILGYNCIAYGDSVWPKFQLPYNGPLYDGYKLANIYATAKVCPNVHTESQLLNKSYLNERAFTIALCGGIQIVDTDLASKYLGEGCVIADNTTDFIQKTVSIIENPRDYDRILNTVKHVAENHTYLTRLADLFSIARLKECADHMVATIARASTRHYWDIEARLGAERRGVVYEKSIVTA